MRDIKFRAWDIKRNKMWSSEQLGNDQVGLLPDGRGFANISGESHDRTVLFEHLIPLQYTGLKDKNGVDIYEGDIVKSRTLKYKRIFEKGKVVFKKGKFSIIYYDFTKLEYDLDYMHIFVEVIGNIYNTKELDKGE